MSGSMGGCILRKRVCMMVCIERLCKWVCARECIESLCKRVCERMCIVREGLENILCMHTSSAWSIWRHERGTIHIIYIIGIYR